MSPLPTFDNTWVRELPADPEAGPRRRQVHAALFSRVAPTPVAGPRLMAHSPEVAAMLGLTEAEVHDPAFAQAMAGNLLWPGMEPVATTYGGHQFGHWAGQLGDGRAISLGEAMTPGGRQELQLKGAGPTPYARRADGRAVLRSSVREFLCSEAMHHLGVPTTRALSLVATGEDVVRDMFYDGRPRPEPGAVVCRVAPSFTRFGHFELPASRGDDALVRRLVDFTIARDFPALADAPDRHAAWFAEVCGRTATMVAHWMRVGFVHGVMNTDNMAITGATIDYGPYGWVDDFDPEWTPNTTDAEGRRYAFGRQPAIAHWNLVRLAEAIAPVFDEEDPLHAGLDQFVATFEAASRRDMAAKLGLAELQPDDVPRYARLLALLHEGEVDMTLFFRGLADLDPAAPAIAPEAFYDEDKRRATAPAFEAWLAGYADRLRHDPLAPAARRATMRAASPRYVLRNYLAQQAIERAEAGDDAGIHELLDVMRRPYDDQPGREAYAGRRPEWARHKAGCSALSCSS